MASGLALLWVYLTLPGWLLGAGLAAIVGSIVASGARRRLAPTLADDVKFVYRKTYLRSKWPKLCKSAGLEEARKGPTGTEGVALHRPRLCHAHVWQLPLTRQRWLTRIVQTPTGMRITVDGTTVGMPLEAFEGKAGNSICSTVHAKGVRAYEHPDYSHFTGIDLTFGEPFKQTVSHRELPVSAIPGIVRVGKDAQHKVVSLSMLVHHLLVGASRSGKSSQLWLILKGLVDQKLPFVLWCIDPKGGVEFFNLKGRAFIYEDDILKCKLFVENALKAILARQQEMKAAGVRKWLPGDERWPLVLILIDELITFLKMLKKQKIKINGEMVAADDALSFLLTQGLGIGFVCVSCSQLVQKETLGTMRDLFSSITLFRVTSDEQVTAAGFKPSLHPAHKIPIGDQFAGQAYMLTDEGHIVHYRAGWCPDEERERITKLIHEQSKKYWATPTALPETIEFVPSELELVTNGATK
jgi:hypothetical protein